MKQIRIKANDGREYLIDYSGVKKRSGSIIILEPQKYYGLSVSLANLIGDVHLAKTYSFHLYDDGSLSDYALENIKLRIPPKTSLFDALGDLDSARFKEDFIRYQFYYRKDKTDDYQRLINSLGDLINVEDSDLRFLFNIITEREIRNEETWRLFSCRLDDLFCEFFEEQTGVSLINRTLLDFAKEKLDLLPPEYNNTHEEDLNEW